MYAEVKIYNRDSVCLDRRLFPISHVPEHHGSNTPTEADGVRLSGYMLSLYSDKAKPEPEFCPGQRVMVQPPKGTSFMGQVVGMNTAADGGPSIGVAVAVGDQTRVFYYKPEQLEAV